MKINRAALLSALKFASPALAGDKNAVEELSHFWFDGKYLSAYDDLIGVRLEFPTEFTGGVRGDKLVGVLENSRALTVTLEPEDDGNLVLKAGSAIITLALRPIEDWFWTPQLPDEDGYRVDKDFLSAISLALMSVGSTKIMNPEQRGVTVIEQDGDVDFYSTDSLAISWMRVPSNNGRVLGQGMSRCILPTQFCELFTKTMKAGAQVIFDESAVYAFDTVKLGTEKNEQEAQMMLFSKLVDDENPLPFERVVQDYISAKGSFLIPKRLRMSVDRALVMLESGQATDLSVKDGSLLLYAKTDHGIVDDELELEKFNHPDIKIRIDFGLLKRALDGREKMTVTNECLIMTGPTGFYHIVASK